ncbi:hypothetical protein D3C86_1761130 [compost metagenome]
MAEAHRLALAATGRQVDEGAGNGRRGADGHGAGAHHGVMQLAHGERPHQQIDLTVLHLLAAGCAVILRRRDEGNFRGVLAGRCLFCGLD